MKSHNLVLFSYLPTKFSNTELFPADCPPTTAIWGKSSVIWTPSCVNASCNLFTIGISCSIPIFPAIFRPEYQIFTEENTTYYTSLEINEHGRDTLTAQKCAWLITIFRNYQRSSFRNFSSTGWWVMRRIGLRCNFSK